MLFLSSSAACTSAVRDFDDPDAQGGAGGSNPTGSGGATGNGGSGQGGSGQGGSGQGGSGQGGSGQGGGAACSMTTDQVYDGPANNGLEVTPTNVVTQTFTVGVGGVLHAIDLVGVRHHNGVSMVDLIVSLMITDNNGDPAQVLDMVHVPPNLVSTDGSVDVVADFSAFGLPVSPGDVLAIRLETSTDDPNYAWSAFVPGTYGGGTGYQNTIELQWDMLFRTHVCAPP
jgi:hypothetical protein